MKIHTQNSTYEADEERKRIRRVLRDGTAGDWEQYRLLQGLKVGKPVIIHLADETGFRTSVVRSIERP